MKKAGRFILLSGVSLAAFLVFTAVVSLVDVAPIGPMESRVGLSSLNQAAWNAVGQSRVAFVISEVLGGVALLAFLASAALGAIQLVRRRSLRRVDYGILALGVLFLSMFIAYVLFELLAVNYSPLLEDGALTPSYPSSHTLLSLCISLGVGYELMDRLKGRCWCRRVTLLACFLLGVGLPLTRLLSGVHWVTDILASLLLTAVLFFLFLAAREILPGLGIGQVNEKERDRQ